jgi:8-oxo-dGTP pyrophosphatase MutT (NUDIX family)
MSNSSQKSLALTCDTTGNRKKTNLNDRDTWLKLNRFVGIIPVNAKAEILLQLRSEDDCLYSNYEILPGGRVEDGEILEQAILGKVKEELGFGCNLGRQNPFSVKYQVIIHRSRAMN